MEFLMVHVDDRRDSVMTSSLMDGQKSHYG